MTGQPISRLLWQHLYRGLVRSGAFTLGMNVRLLEPVTDRREDRVFTEERPLTRTVR